MQLRYAITVAILGLETQVVSNIDSSFVRWWWWMSQSHPTERYCLPAMIHHLWCIDLRVWYYQGKIMMEVNNIHKIYLCMYEEQWGVYWQFLFSTECRLTKYHWQVSHTCWEIILFFTKKHCCKLSEQNN